MSGALHDDGRRLIARMLEGAGDRIDGMYVEWTSGRPADSAPRTRAYFDGLNRSDGRGYVRMKVANAYADDAMTVHFNAMLTREDIPLETGDASIVGVTLVSLGNTPDQDILVFSTDFGKPVTVAEGVFTTVHASIRLGAAK